MVWHFAVKVSLFCEWVCTDLIWIFISHSGGSTLHIRKSVDRNIFLVIISLTSSWEGVYWFHMHASICPSICPSIRPSLCGQNHVWSISSTILARPISYLHTLSSNFSGCVASKVLLQNSNIWICGKFFNILVDFVFFWLGIPYESIVRAVRGWQGYSQNAGVLVALVFVLN